ncbi:hypothetical protein FRC09_010866 [Ceratobasidium sp. 395]|nr:hypothetical protein FRC09_010866 [Ceratobasidium sp. 395]
MDKASFDNYLSARPPSSRKAQSSDVLPNEGLGWYAGPESRLLQPSQIGDWVGQEQILSGGDDYIWGRLERLLIILHFMLRRTPITNWAHVFAECVLRLLGGGRIERSAQDNFPLPNIGPGAALDDVFTTKDEHKPISGGLFTMEKADKPLVYTYNYHELKIILEGKFADTFRIRCL